jgi:serine/threonine-protein kinase
MAYQIAEVYAWRGQKDLAFEWMEQALRQHDAGLCFLKFDPLLDSIRHDARFASLLREMKLPE